MNQFNQLKETNNKLEAYKIRFEKCCDYLKNFGFKGDVFLKSGFLLFGANDKNSASMIRKGFKKLSKEVIECRFGTQSVFVWTTDLERMSKKQVKSPSSLLDPLVLEVFFILIIRSRLEFYVIYLRITQLIQLLNYELHSVCLFQTNKS